MCVYNVCDNVCVCIMCVCMCVYVRVYDTRLHGQGQQERWTGSTSACVCIIICVCICVRVCTAVDNIVEGLQARGMRVVRIGNPAKVRSFSHSLVCVLTSI